MTSESFPTPHPPSPLARARSPARSRDNPRLVLGLPTGRTPIPLYRELAALHRARRADFSRATTFNLDEFLGLAGDDPRSYRAFMQRHLFDHINLPPRRIHFLNGAARDAAAECARYERAIARAGGIDLLILGLGANGHIGFNEPARRARRGDAPDRAQRAATRRAPTPRCSTTASARSRARRCRWGWRRFFTPGGSCCWRPGARRRAASSG